MQVVAGRISDLRHPVEADIQVRVGNQRALADADLSNGGEGGVEGKCECVGPGAADVRERIANV